MTLKISEKANLNYLAKVVKLTNLRKHPNADRLQVVTVDGNNIITSLTAKDGDLYVYFPLESALNKEFLSWSNAFEDKELNTDKEIKGFFNNKGRVRAVRLRSEKSEGYIVPVSAISDWILFSIGKNFVFTEEHVNTEFDLIFNTVLCEKYINYVAIRKQDSENKKKQRKTVKEKKLIDNQFHLHIDTTPLKKYIDNINPDDYIHISRKLHGTSFVVSNVLCRKPLKWYEKVLHKLGVNIVNTQYDLVYSSRKVIKNNVLDTSGKEHFYGYDLWGDIAKTLEEYLTAGLTFYGECVGYTKSGAYIQSGYDYGCEPGKFKTYIYRITLTNVNGKVFEFSTQQVKDYCERFGLNSVPELYYGKAKNLFDIPVNEEWTQQFLENLCNEYLEKDCGICVNSVPDEGVVLRREISDIDVYKLKSFRFFELESKQLDSDEVDLETQESEEQIDA